jgi:hypothetical protein
MSITLEQIEDVLWYSGMLGEIGVILVNTGFGYKAYIGVGTGINEDYDKMRIAELGAKFQDGPRLWPDRKWWADFPDTHPDRPTEPTQMQIDRGRIDYLRGTVADLQLACEAKDLRIRQLESVVRFCRDIAEEEYPHQLGVRNFGAEIVLRHIIRKTQEAAAGEGPKPCPTCNGECYDPVSRTYCPTCNRTGVSPS